jgi:hypothetical protein
LNVASNIKISKRRFGKMRRIQRLGVITPESVDKRASES